jgi:cellulose biosynthesis protein BcsQ
MKTLALWTIKGGVGKTAAAVHLAHVAGRNGARTLLWDLDPQGAASFYLRIAPRVAGGARRVVRRSTDLGRLVRSTDFDNLDLLPADFSYRHMDLELDARKRPRKRLASKLEPLAARYDVVLLDCPPSVSLVSESVVRAADAVLVPVIPSTLSLRTLYQVRDVVARGRPPHPEVLPFLSMVDRRKRLHRDICQDHADGVDGFLRTTIPSASIVERTGLTRAPVTATAPRSPAARAFVELWDEIEARCALNVER